jgi:hypothetical protein
LSREWKSLESEQAQLNWNKVARRVFEKDFSCSEPLICPICEANALKFSFVHHGTGDRGGFWIWCSACRHYSHSSCAIPKWWVSLENIPFSELTPEPNWFEENWEHCGRVG